MLVLVGASEPPIHQPQAAFISPRLQLKLLEAEQNHPSSWSTMPTQSETDSCSSSSSPLIPGLPDDLAKTCLALVPRTCLPAMGAVSRRWMAFITSREFVAVRKEVGRLEEWVYVLTMADDDEAGEEGTKRSRWEVLLELEGSPLDEEDHRRRKKKRVLLPPMPGPPKAGFGVVVLDGKLLVVGGYDAGRGKEAVSDEVYQYDACLNRWTVLAKMNVARRDFACAELDGAVYAAGGVGPGGERLCSVEAYDPQRNEWTLMPESPLRRPRWGCLGFGLSGRGLLYVLGGRSSYTIGNARSVDVYDPRRRAWDEVRNQGAGGGGVVMVTSHAVVGGSRLVCVEWKDQRTLVVFHPAAEEDGGGSWRRVPVPLTGSSRTRFCLGALRGKVLLFATEEEAGYRTLVYDPAAPAGSEWRTSELKPSGVCMCSVTIKV